MIFISIVAIILYIIASVWTWKNLGFMENTKKVAFITIGIIVMYVVTLIIFQMAQDGIEYQNESMQKDVKNILLIVFTGLNSMIFIPQVGKTVDKIIENDTDKDQIKKRIIVIAIVFVICLFFESGYMKDTQEGILEIYNAMK